MNLRTRKRYAFDVLAAAGVADPALEAAFAATEREAFVGAPPWMIRAGGPPSTSGRGPDDFAATSDPAALYGDVLVALDPARGINNGQPSLHAMALHALAVRPGERVVHVGAGSGYYSAILGRLVGADGHVTALEIDPALAARARACLARMAWVTVEQRSGTEATLPAADAVYVSAAASAPAPVWLAALQEGGRLLFPLAPARERGGMLLLRREGPRWPARFLPWRVGFIGCAGAQDDETNARLAQAFARGEMAAVRSLRLDGEPDDTAWVAGDGWWLSTAA